MTKQTKKARRILVRKLNQLRRKTKQAAVVPLLAAALLLLPVVSEAQSGTRIERYVKSQMTEAQRKAYEERQAAEQAGLWAFIKVVVLGL